MLEVSVARAGERLQALGHRGSLVSPAGDQQDRVVTGDRADHVGVAGLVDGGGEVVGRTWWGAEDDEVDGSGGRDQQLLAGPSQPGRGRIADGADRGHLTALSRGGIHEGASAADLDGAE